MPRRIVPLLVALCSLAPAPSHAAQRLILRPEPATTFTVEGHYPTSAGICPGEAPPPLRARFHGRLAVDLARDGTIRIINTLSMSSYLEGLDEVPRSWPIEALRAQVIAARSYAIATMRREAAAARSRGYDICATVACQVYRGASVTEGAFGERWIDAVRSTHARALTYGGSVIQAFYFSTSTGRTRSSFPGGTPQPWLPSVSGEDAGAPLGRWRAVIALRDLTAVLRAAGTWSGRAITGVSDDGDAVVLRRGGRSVRVSKESLRLTLNARAPCMFPSRYPGLGTQTGGKLPQTLPSTTFGVSQRDGALVASGRGWGHGVGMSQWGAKSLADRGRGAQRILSHYYGPAEIRTIDEPRRIRVLVASGLRRVRVEIGGGARVSTETGSVLRPGDAFVVTGGKRLEVRRARGGGLEPILDVRTSVRRLSASPGARVRIPFETSRPARVRTLLLRDGEVVARSPERSFEAGRHVGRILLSAVPPGRYEAVLVGYDGIDRVRTRPVRLDVTAPPPPPVVAMPPAAVPPSPGRGWAFAAALALLAAAGLLASRLISRR